MLSATLLRNIFVLLQICHGVALYLNICFSACFRGRDRMVVGFPTTYAISTYHH